MPPKVPPMVPQTIKVNTVKEIGDATFQKYATGKKEFVLANGLCFIGSNDHQWTLVVPDDKYLRTEAIAMLHDSRRVTSR
ncbi:hypothetical protein SPRG_16451 [Saprolegnia parasitica CBS 223.65]|uniref:Uncharacterized protein n=1 Tax=Saprolegnia parasitica (strain CBS 223.65) TaxID=695850 RepID=A0A067BHX7_SAPPC|nr:hypothetical protein SPRG_16451 [Saprolegnia parasitica CBS 223.65]KDO18004.1 hypothetical protein SPRG_16451 [Saprolegnia parasitica CBS 223.65]|eukprot:XP_012211288.1 hypothetical protein SPRG_16451 [Saprolegnia parasitica CBS 223.65]